MKTLRYLVGVLVLLIVIPATLSAQPIKQVKPDKGELKEAEKEYSENAFIVAQDIYLSMAENGYRTPEVLLRIANTYYFNAQYLSALKWYEEYFDKEDRVRNPFDYLHFAQCLKASGQNEKALEYYKLFVEKADVKSEDGLEAKDYIDFIEQNSGRCDIDKLSINSDVIDFGVGSWGDKIYFASTRDSSGVFTSIKSSWDGLDFLDIYESTVDTFSNTYTEPVKIKGDVNNAYHESSPVITKDGMTMYFTRSTMKGKEGKSSQVLKLMRASYINGEWSNVQELTSLNGETFSSAHPALSPDEKYLFFVSDRPGSLGNTDIYVTDIKRNGSFGPIRNVGKMVNTAGRETFPFVSKDNKLYFASDGHFGLGGLDVFVVDLDKQGNQAVGRALNLGRPINSYADDFGYSIDIETKKGYFNSNRIVGDKDDVTADSKIRDGKELNYDNIYSFIENEPLKNVFEARIVGTITDKHTGEPIPNATIIIKEFDESDVAMTEDDPNAFVATADEEGKFEFIVNKFKAYRLRAGAKTYEKDEKISKPGLDSQSIDFILERNIQELDKGVDLAKILNIPMIYFDYNKATIRKDSEVELEKLVTVMKKYPELKIEIRSHTDSRGRDSYNLRLSERRAESTKKYIVSRGVPAKRLKAKGYGETQILNGCTNGVKCTEAQHESNRRSEFIIID